MRRRGPEEYESAGPLFDGVTFEEELDRSRLGAQLAAVRKLMGDPGFREPGGLTTAGNRGPLLFRLVVSR